MVNQYQFAFLNEDPEQKPTVIPPYLIAIRKLYLDNALEFQKIFGRRLFGFWDNLVGFDIVKFDEEFIKSAVDQSLKDAVFEKYGEAAVALLYRLIA